MRQIHKGKRRLRSASEQQTPLPPDARDADIVHAHEAARRGGSRAQSDGGGSTKPIPGSR